MNYKSIIVGSAPRTGGMWIYNVVREIFVNLEKKIIPLLKEESKIRKNN